MDTAAAEYELSKTMASGLSYEAARKQLTASQADLLDAAFQQRVSDVLARHGTSQHIRTDAEIDKWAVDKWNKSAYRHSKYATAAHRTILDDARMYKRHSHEEQQYTDIAQKYLVARINATVNGTAFVNPLTKSDLQFIQSKDPNWEMHLDTTANLTHAQQVHTAQNLNGIQESMLASIAAGDKIDLSEEEQQLLQQNPLQSQTILDRVHDAEHQKLMRDYVSKTASDLNISTTELADYYEHVNAGMKPETAWMLQAHQQGFLNVAQYDKYRTSANPEDDLQTTMTQQQQFAQKALDLHARATKAGFEDVDSYLLNEMPGFEYNADASEISAAHSMDMTLPEYLQYLEGIRDDPNKDPEYTRQWNADMYHLAKTYTDIVDGSAPKIDPVLERAQYDLEDMIQRSELGGAAVASALPAYVDHKGDIVQ